MKQLPIVKTGTTYTSIGKKHGDFEDFIIRVDGTFHVYRLWYRLGLDAGGSPQPIKPSNMVEIHNESLEVHEVVRLKVFCVLGRNHR